MVEQPAVQEVVEPQGVSEPPGAPQLTQALWGDRLQAILEEGGEEAQTAIRQHTVWNAIIQRDAQRERERARKEVRQEYEEQEARSRDARQILTQYQALAPNQKIASLQNPAYATRYHQAVASLSQTAPEQETIYSKRAWDSVGKLLKATEGFEDLPFEEITSKFVDDLPGAITAIAKHKSEKERKQMEKELDAKFTAKFNELEAKMLKGTAQPEISSPTGQPGARTWEQTEQAYADGLISNREYEEARKARG